MRPLILFVSAILHMAAPVYADDPLAHRLEGVVRDLTSQYETKRSSGSPVALAVLDFDSSEKLTKEKVGLAAAELLTRRFLAVPRFKVVERANVAAVLKEEHFQQTGAIEPGTVAKVGHLVGAQVLVIGRIEKSQSHYEISCRMVEVETGEVLALAYQAIPAPVFEQEGSPYLVLVPETEAIGIYAAGLYGGSVPRHVYPPYNYSLNYGSGQEAAYSTQAQASSANSGAGGVGIRYQLLRRLQVDVAYWPHAFSGSASLADIGLNGLACQNVHGTPPCTLDVSEFSFSGAAGQAALDWTQDISPRIRTYVGAGIMQYWINSGTKSYYVYESPNSLTTGFVRTGVEWKPQPRVGLAAFVRYSLEPELIPVSATGVDGSNGAYHFIDFEIPRLQGELTLSLYF